MKKNKLIIAAIFTGAILLVLLIPKPSKDARSAGGREKNVAAVRTAEVVVRDLWQYIETNGEVEPVNTVEVFPDISGKLTRILVSLGSRVEAGQVIAEIDPSKPGAKYALSPVYAPISGTVTSMPLQRGTTVQTGTAVAVIGDIATVRISALIPERDVAVLKVGLPAILRFEAYPDVEFKARVVRVSPLVDSVSRTKQIYLSPDTGDDRINAGMFAGIKLFTILNRECVTIPDDAILSLDDRFYAFVALDDQTVSRRELVKGISVDGLTAVMSGISAGERVVVQGTQTLSDGARIRDIGTAGDSQ